MVYACTIMLGFFFTNGNTMVLFINYFLDYLTLTSTFFFHLKDIDFHQTFKKKNVCIFSQFGCSVRKQMFSIIFFAIVKESIRFFAQFLKIYSKRAFQTILGEIPFRSEPLRLKYIALSFERNTAQFT